MGVESGLGRGKLFVLDTNPDQNQLKTFRFPIRVALRSLILFQKTLSSLPLNVTPLLNEELLNEAPFNYLIKIHYN